LPFLETVAAVDDRRIDQIVESKSGPTCIPSENMEQKTRSLWKLRLAALGFGALSLAVVYGGALLLTNDVRLDAGGKVHDSFGLSGVPTLVVLDRNGRVRLTRAGYNAAETTFRRDLVQFLKTL
jgi:hypothetical protein